MRNLQDYPRNSAIVQYAVWAPLTAFAATLVTVWWLIENWLSAFALDHLNRRSLHDTPVPRVGGVVLHVVVLLSWALVPLSLPRELWLGYILLLLVSFIDDLGGLPVTTRLIVPLLAAFGLIGWLRLYWMLCFPVLTFFPPFVADASATQRRPSTSTSRALGARVQAGEE